FVRAGHGHAGVLLVLSLVYFLYLDAKTDFSDRTEWIVGAILLAGILAQSGGFFVHLGVGEAGRASIGTRLTRTGALLIATALVVLPVGIAPPSLNTQPPGLIDDHRGQEVRRGRSSGPYDRGDADEPGRGLQRRRLRHCDHAAHHRRAPPALGTRRARRRSPEHLALLRRLRRELRHHRHHLGQSPRHLQRDRGDRPSFVVL